MWRTEIRRSCEWNAVQNLRDKSCAGSPAQRLKSRLSRGARDVLAPKRYEAQESTHLLLVVVDELLFVLSSVSHGCLWNRKGKGGGYARKSGGKVRAARRLQLVFHHRRYLIPIFRRHDGLLSSVIGKPSLSAAALRSIVPLWYRSQ